MSVIPQYNRKNTPTPRFLEEGEYDFALSQFVHKPTRSGNGDLLIGEYVVDNGPSAGAKAENSFFLGHEKQFGEEQLQAFCNAARRADGSLDPAVDQQSGKLILVTPNGQQTIDPAAALRDPDGDPVPVNAGGFVYQSDVQTLAQFAAQFVVPGSLPLRARFRVVHTYNIEKDNGNWEDRVPKAKYDEHRALGKKGVTRLNLYLVGPPAAPPSIPVAVLAPAGGDGAQAQPPVPQQAAFPGVQQQPVVQQPVQQVQQPVQQAPVAAPAGGTAFPFGNN